MTCNLRHLLLENAPHDLGIQETTIIASISYRVGEGQEVYMIQTQREGVLASRTFANDHHG
jgi:hypothetical protein